MKHSRSALHIILPALIVLAGAVCALWHHTHPRQLPLEECSELYQRYKDHPGIRAAYIRDKQINDTLSLPVTLLQADDSATFAQLLKEWGKTDDFIAYLFSPIITVETRFTGLHPKGRLFELADPDLMNNDVSAIIPVRRMIALFHPNAEEQYELLLDENLSKTIQIQDP